MKNWWILSICLLLVVAAYTIGYIDHRKRMDKILTENHDLHERIVELKREVNHNAKMALDMFPRAMTDSIGVYSYQDVEATP